MRSAINLAMQSPLVTAEAVEATSYPQLAQQYQVFAVPKTVINDRVSFEGAVPEDYLWSAIWRALVRTIFAQPDRASARQQLEQVAASLERRFPQVASLLREAAEEVLAYMDFPPEHWRGIHSTNVLERLNRELARRCDVVGIFPNVAAVLRLLGALLEEQQDEWLVQRRYFTSDGRQAPAGRNPCLGSSLQLLS